MNAKREIEKTPRKIQAKPIRLFFILSMATEILNPLRALPFHRSSDIEDLDAFEIKNKVSNKRLVHMLSALPKIHISSSRLYIEFSDPMIF